MANNGATHQGGVLRCWQLWVGVVLLIAAIRGLVWVNHVPEISRLEWPHFAIALALVIGAILFLVGLHVSRRVNKERLEWVTIFLAVAAIVFAVWQFHDARHQESRMEGLAEQMTTRFVGFFPKNMRDVNEVVSHAEKTLDIMTDYVGYGHYSAPEEFDRYLRKLEDLRVKGVVVRMIVYSKRQAEGRYRTQFTDDEFKAALGLPTARNKHPSSPSDKMEAFCRKFNYGFCEDFDDDQKRKDLKREDFQTFMFHRQLDYMEDLLERGVQIKQTSAEQGDQPLPFFLWCEDNHEAVFTFINEERDTSAPREVSFRTRDSRLVEDTLERRFDEMWRSDKNQQVALVVIKGGKRPSWDQSDAAPSAPNPPAPRR